MMYGDRAGFLANFFQHFAAQRTVVAMYLDLDQFMRFQADINLVQHFFSQAIIAYHDHRAEAVAEGAQMTDLFGIELLRHRLFIQKRLRSLT